MKQINFKQMAVLAMFALTAISAQAQTTPEAIIGQCPEMMWGAPLALIDVYPPEGTLEKKVLDAMKAKDAFLDKIDSLNQIRRKVADKADAGMEAAGKKDADRLLRQQTGRSLEQVQNMSDAEAMKMADNMASEKLGAMGLGNMSLGDLQALEGKSDEEIMKAMDGIAPAQIGANQKQAGYPKAQAEFKKINDRWAEIDRLNNQDIEAAAVKLKNLYEQHYREALQEKWEILKPFRDGKVEQKLLDNGYEAALANYRSVMYNFRYGCYAEWRLSLNAVRERIKSKLADAARYDKLMAQIMSATPSVAKALPSVGYDIAGQYLNATGSIISPPIPELNFDVVIKDN